MDVIWTPPVVEKSGIVHPSNPPIAPPIIDTTMSSKGKTIGLGPDTVVYNYDLSQCDSAFGLFGQCANSARCKSSGVERWLPDPRSDWIERVKVATPFSQFLERWVGAW